MTLRSNIAQLTSGALTWGLKHVVHRPGATLPGNVALRIDPAIVRELRGKLRRGSIVVVGTNGKTTVTNLMANVIEQSGQSVLCNRTGANLKSGIASALLQGRPSDWGVIECDELWLAHVLPDLRARWVLLLNLFRDQLDRCGEIDRIQESIVGALVASPETGLIFNADDPLCAFVASRAAEERARAGLAPLRMVAFGVGESMHLAQNAVADATMCQACSHIFRYEYRQYGQLGSYVCPECGFSRPHLDYVARDIDLMPDGVSFEVNAERTPRYAAPALHGTAPGDGADAGAGASGHGAVRLHARLAGTYNVYNLLAIYACAATVGCSADDVQRAVDAFDPRNGRLQRYVIDGRPTLLNLAKNPTGFNQNLRIVAAEKAPHAVAFFINDQVVDGHDVSWIWDIDFEELVAGSAMEAGVPVRVFAGGTRRNDLQVRLKYAGVTAELVDGIEDVFAALAAGAADDGYAATDGAAGGGHAAAAGEVANAAANAAAAGAAADDAAGEAAVMPADAPVYAIANYSALPPVKRVLDGLAASQPNASGGHAASETKPSPSAAAINAKPSPSVISSDRRESRNLAATTQASGADLPAPDAAASPVVIAHVLPELLNLYGDGGNVRILEQRLRWRGIPVEVRRVNLGDPVTFDDVDLVFLGGGPDREQTLAAETLADVRDDLARYIDEAGPVLAICGGYQILGRTWLLGDEEVPGLGLIDVETRRPGTSGDRLIGNIALRSPVADAPVVGFENHASRTYLDADAQSFGEVVSKTGAGNNDDTAMRADGILQGSILGTYLHGTLLAKNPEVADWLLARAVAHHAERTGTAAYELAPLDDAAELAANAFMCDKII